MVKRARYAVPNATLYDLRDSRGLTQQELAEELTKLAWERHRKRISIDNVTVSRWERGVIDRPSPIYRRLLAEYFDVSLDELGFTRPSAKAPTSTKADPLALDTFVLDHSQMAAEPRVAEDQETWKRTRQAMNQHRAGLARAAVQLYDAADQLDDTGLLTRSDWMLPEPIRLHEVRLEYVDDVVPSLLSGVEPTTRALRPLATAAARFQRYSHAVRDIDHPGLFENRLSYRLVAIAPDQQRPTLRYGHTTYFETVDVNEAVAHEFGAAHLGDEVGTAGIRPPSWGRLPFRRLVGDPFDLTRRPLLTSINTLTIRNDPQRPTFVLHGRSAARVAVAGGTLHVMPAGVFQPSSVMPAARTGDFDLWRNIMREYSEEFLGNQEHGGDGAPVDYEQLPFAAMAAARTDDRFRVFYLGLALDALTLYGEILTVTVIDPDTYDQIFADMVTSNDEGAVVTIGGTKSPTSAIPFDHFAVPRLLEHPALAPAAAACLKLAWEHRDALLA